MTTLKEGQQAPNFAVKDTQGKILHLSDFKGKYVVLYFYPKDMTPGCTIEAIEFNKDLDGFKMRNAVVLGVSLDDETRHQKFTAKHDLSFPLLADTDAAVSKMYGVYGKKRFLGKSYMGIERTTFIIDKKGIILKVFNKVNPKGHSREVMQTLDLK